MNQIVFTRLRTTSRWILATHFIIDTGDRTADLAELSNQMSQTFTSSTIAVAWFIIGNTLEDATAYASTYSPYLQRTIVS